MRTDRKPKGGFVRFMKKLDNPEGKETNNDTTDLLLAQERLGRELYQRYEGLLEWIAGECNWDNYLDWVWDGRSGAQRQAFKRIRLSLGLDIPPNSMGMYNGDRSGTLGKAVERILSDHQSEQQESVSIRASGERLNPSPAYFDLEQQLRTPQSLRNFILYGPSSNSSRSG